MEIKILGVTFTAIGLIHILLAKQVTRYYQLFSFFKEFPTRIIVIGTGIFLVIGGVIVLSI